MPPSAEQLHFYNLLRNETNKFRGARVRAPAACHRDAAGAPPRAARGGGGWRQLVATWRISAAGGAKQRRKKRRQVRSPTVPFSFVLLLYSLSLSLASSLYRGFFLSSP